MIDRRPDYVKMSDVESAYAREITDLSIKVVALCNAIGPNLSFEEACEVAVNTRARLAELEAAGLDLTAPTASDLLDEVARRMGLL